MVTHAEASKDEPEQPEKVELNLKTVIEIMFGEVTCPLARQQAQKLLPVGYMIHDSFVREVCLEVARPHLRKYLPHLTWLSPFIHVHVFYLSTLHYMHTLMHPGEVYKETVWVPKLKLEDIFFHAGYFSVARKSIVNKRA